MKHIITVLIAIAATGISLLGDIYINEATIAVGRKISAQLIAGCFLFGMSGLLWFFVFKKLNFSAVVLLYLFLSVIFAVGIDYVRYGNQPTIKVWIGFVLVLIAIFLMKDYLIKH